MVTREINLRNSALLLVGLLLHIVLINSAAEVTEGFPSLQNPLILAGIFGALLLTTVLLWHLPVHRGKDPGILNRGIAALAPLPLYLLCFPSAWGLCTAGMVCCLTLGHILLIASWTARRRLGVDDTSLLKLASANLAILANLASIFVILLLRGGRVDLNPQAAWAAYGLIGFSVCASLLVEKRLLRPSVKTGPYLEYVLLPIAAAAMLHPQWRPAGLPILATRQAVAGGRLWLREHGTDEIWHYLTERPAHLLVLSFAFVIAVGTVLLSLTAATRLENGLSILDALFTATSATCVTGLIVVDTGTDLSAFGQTVVLTLIQIGGLGIMTISVFVALALGRRVGLRGEFAVREMIGEQRNRVAVRLISFIILTTFATEFAGACLLTWGFVRAGNSVPESIYLGVFHSISAFCNAGFALFSDSFVGMAETPFFPIALSAMIILGGLGFGVLFTLMQLAGRRTTDAGPHVKMVLLVSLVLCVGGCVLLWCFERGHAFAGLSLGDSVVNAWFQSVTARTAGFNTVDLNAFRPASNLLMMVLMFIGAAPGSTGGGIKVTTFAVLILLLRAVLNGREDVVVFGRTIEQETVRRATALACLGGFFLLTASLFLLLTEPLPPHKVFFEAVSAFGTVGLSLGITPLLTPPGKLTIIFLMFVGRIGPLTLLVMMQPRRRSNVAYPAARVMIG